MVKENPKPFEGLLIVTRNFILQMRTSTLLNHIICVFYTISKCPICVLDLIRLFHILFQARTKVENSLSPGTIKAWMARKLTLSVGASFTEINWALGWAMPTMNEAKSCHCHLGTVPRWQEEQEIVWQLEPGPYCLPIWMWFHRYPSGKMSCDIGTRGLLFLVLNE